MKGTPKNSSRGCSLNQLETSFQMCECATKWVAHTSRVSISSLFSPFFVLHLHNLQFFKRGCVWLHVFMYMHMQSGHVSPGMDYMYWILLQFSKPPIHQYAANWSHSNWQNWSLFAPFYRYWSKLIEHSFQFLTLIYDQLHSELYKGNVWKRFLLYKKGLKKRSEN